jgi:hypothetical protein
MHKNIKTILFSIIAGAMVMGCGMMATPAQPIPTPEVDLPAGPSDCSVPNIVGLDRNAAERMLGTLGVEPVWTEQYDPSIAPGLVISQDPPAGAELTECQGEVIVVLNTDVTSTATGDPSEAWTVFTSPELGLSFRFPPLPDTTYTYNEWPTEGSYRSGTLVEWAVTIPDEGWTYNFAGCGSRDLVLGRGGWPTDSSRWRQTESGTFIDFHAERSIQVTPLRIVQHPAGTEGLIYDPNESFWGDMPANLSGVDRAAILNLPEGTHPKIGCLSFYFYDEIPLEQIEAVLLSVEFTHQ